MVEVVTAMAEVAEEMVKVAREKVVEEVVVMVVVEKVVEAVVVTEEEETATDEEGKAVEEEGEVAEEKETGTAEEKVAALEDTMSLAPAPQGRSNAYLHQHFSPNFWPRVLRRNAVTVICRSFELVTTLQYVDMEPIPLRLKQAILFQMFHTNSFKSASEVVSFPTLFFFKSVACLRRAPIGIY